MQNRSAGTKPNCAVRIPMAHKTRLLTAATTRPCHIFLPPKRSKRYSARTTNNQAGSFMTKYLARRYRSVPSSSDWPRGQAHDGRNQQATPSRTFFLRAVPEPQIVDLAREHLYAKIVLRGFGLVQRIDNFHQFADNSGISATRSRTQCARVVSSVLFA